MSTRLENAVSLDINIDELSLKHKLPVFSLQLLAENCFKHNIASEENPLTIRLFQKDPYSITLTSNFQPKEIKNESFGIGIENLKMRYALSGIKDGLIIEQTPSTYSSTLKLI